MDRREFLKTIIGGIVVGSGGLAFPSLAFGSSNKSSNLVEYCFSISPNKSIGMRAVDTTPEKFLELILMLKLRLMAHILA